MTTLFVLVPKPGTAAIALIDKGSGIVAARVPDLERDRVLVYYEGNRFSAENLKTFEVKVTVAAGRLAKKYPTIARAVLSASDFDVVGTYTFSDDWQGETALVITDEARVKEWTE